MAAISTVDRNSVSMRLHNGTSQGTILTVGVSLGTLAKTGFDADKVLNIVDAVEDVLSKSVVSVQHTQVSYLTRA